MFDAMLYDVISNSIRYSYCVAESLRARSLLPARGSAFESNQSIVFMGVCVSTQNIVGKLSCTPFDPDYNHEWTRGQRKGQQRKEFTL